MRLSPQFGMLLAAREGQNVGCRTSLPMGVLRMSRMRWILSLAVVALLSGVAGQAGAVPSPIPITNPGFESPVLADGAYNYLATGWIRAYHKTRYSEPVEGQVARATFCLPQDGGGDVEGAEVASFG